MPRYYFHVYDGRSAPDAEGTELRDWPAARRGAIQLAGVLIAEQADALAPGEDWRLEVADERGLILFRLDLSMAESSAIARRA